VFTVPLIVCLYTESENFLITLISMQQPDIEDCLKTLAKCQHEHIDFRKMIANSHLKAIPYHEFLRKYREMVSIHQIEPNEELDTFFNNRNHLSRSGVLVVSIYTKPQESCKYNCLYCPTEKNMPKSYLSTESLASVASRLKFSIIEQTRERLRVLGVHNVLDKLECLFLGGTWTSYSFTYRELVIWEFFYAVNTYTEYAKTGRTRPMKSVWDEIYINEYFSDIKIIGITVELRPTDVSDQDIIQMRELGITRIQMGVQHTDNRILELNRRGHTIEDASRLTEYLRSLGFKIDHHYMPNLYGATLEDDIKSFERIFRSPELQPDQIKVYPTVVMKEAHDLYELYISGKFTFYSQENYIRLFAIIKEMVPPYVRINRILRDFAIGTYTSTITHTNIRQLAHNLLEKEGKQCRCIMCREIKKETYDANDCVFSVIDYRTMRGTELFLSFHSRDNKKLYAILRLRFNDDREHSLFRCLLNASIIRELHVYGKVIKTGSHADATCSQHRGLGFRLVEQAIRISREQGYQKIAVISGVGVREYYRKKFDFHTEQTYVIKRLR